jgi:hypothetical protein
LSRVIGENVNKNVAIDKKILFCYNEENTHEKGYGYG